MANGLTDPSTLDIDPAGTNLLLPPLTPVIPQQAQPPARLVPSPQVAAATPPEATSVAPTTVRVGTGLAPPGPAAPRGAPAWLYDAILRNESDGDPTRMEVGAAGERGPMQITKGDADMYGADWERLGRDAPYGMQVGRHIVDDLWQKSGGDWRATMVGYNAGLGSMHSYQRGSQIHLAPLYMRNVYGGQVPPGAPGGPAHDYPQYASRGGFTDVPAGGAGGASGASGAGGAAGQGGPETWNLPATAQTQAGALPLQSVQLAMLGQMIAGTRFIPVTYDPFEQQKRIAQVGAEMHLPEPAGVGLGPRGMAVAPAERGYPSMYHYWWPQPVAQPQAWLQMVREATQGR